MDRAERRAKVHKLVDQWLDAVEKGDKATESAKRYDVAVEVGAYLFDLKMEAEKCSS